nr:MAG TPA: hypothetical protein [Caudoviricetes sp.]
MTKKNKLPRTVVKVSGDKHPVEAVNPNSYLDKHPVWRFFKSDDNHDKWGLKKFNFNDQILDYLESVEGMTWKQIKIDGKKQNHFVDISKFCREAQKRFSDLCLDVDELFSLRINGKKRLWGILENGVFSIVWFDPEHEVCPSHKKHT